MTENGVEITGDVDGLGFSISGNASNGKINVTTQMTNVPEDDAAVIKMYGGNDYYYNPTVVGAKQGSDCFFCGSSDSNKQSSSVPYTTDAKGNAVIDENYQTKNQDENSKKPTKSN